MKDRKLFNPNIIFLDFDGVFNCQTMHESGEKIGRYRSEVYSVARIEMFNELVEEVNAEVVLSASMRVHKDIAERLLKMGFTKRILSKTCSLGMGRCRGDEIKKWIEDNQGLIGVRSDQFNNYVIIDDDSDMLKWQTPHLFQTDGYSGLTPTTCYKIKNFFADRNGVLDPRFLHQENIKVFTLPVINQPDKVFIVDDRNYEQSLTSYRKLYLIAKERYKDLTEDKVIPGWVRPTGPAEKFFKGVTSMSIYLEFQP